MPDRPATPPPRLPRRFAITGAAGYVAPRHMRAMAAAGHDLVAALDPAPCDFLLDTASSPGIARFRDEQELAEHLKELRRCDASRAVDFVAICSPSDLHTSHARLALESGSDAICEKPIALDARELESLQDLEAATGRRVFPVLQMRFHPVIERLAAMLAASRRSRGSRHEVTLTYVTARGPSYFESWKGDDSRSGGILVNIGVHFFDLLVWLFGAVERAEVHHRSSRRAAGLLELERASASWFLSVDAADLPWGDTEARGTVWRSLAVDGVEVDFSAGGGDLHQRLYERVLAGKGLGLADARPSLELVQLLRSMPASIGEPERPALEPSIARA